MDFRNTKIRIKSPEHSKAFQEAVFAAGGKWIMGEKTVKHTNAKFIMVTHNLDMHWTDKDGKFYFENGEEVTFPEPRPLEELNSDGYLNRWTSPIYPEPQQGHPHAELMAQYAEDAKTNVDPWRIWQHYSLDPYGEDWFECQNHPDWCEITEYRRKPKVKLIHGVEVPDISFVPKDGDSYFYPHATNQSFFKWDNCCNGCQVTKWLAGNGLCYPYTEEGKQAAILHAKIMLGMA